MYPSTQVLTRVALALLENAEDDLLALSDFEAAVVRRVVL